MSRSSPGRYALHEFAKNVSHFRATDGGGHALQAAVANPSQWNISGHKGTVVVEYTVFGDRTDGTYTAIDSTHAHLNAPATLVWAAGFEKAPASVRFEIPSGSNWKVATELEERDGAWHAPNRDMLMDAPVELSAHALKEWRVGDQQFRLALHHPGTDAEAAALARLCEAVVIEEEGVFGALPKYDHGSYTFLLDLLPYASGDGMEHRDSTVISGSLSAKESPGRALGVVAHEFFHSWNVRRIRPRALEPFDFQEANMSGELWFAEGFTSYYAPLAMRRAGLMSMNGFTRSMGWAVNYVLTAPGREVFNVVDMSRHAPFVDAATSNDPVNTQNTFISYYTYGQALGLGIDLAIRARFPGKSLDDWMRIMWRRHPDIEKPYTLDDLQAALGEATGDPAFAREIFEKHIYGKEPIDYAQLLTRAGFLLRKKQPVKAGLGDPDLKFSDKGAEITEATLRGSQLYDAGLDRGDRITQWDGKAIASAKELETWLGSHKAGDKVRLDVESRGGKRSVDVILTPPVSWELVTYEQAGQALTPEMTAFRESWLSSKARRPLPKIRKYCPQCHQALPGEYSHCPYDGKELTITPTRDAEDVK